jgi:hypothetical protein
LVYELAGERDRALDALRAAVPSGQPLDEVRGEPALKNLRADPRFQSLISPKSLISATK